MRTWQGSCPLSERFQNGGAGERGLERGDILLDWDVARAFGRGAVSHGGGNDRSLVRPNRHSIDWRKAREGSNPSRV